VRQAEPEAKMPAREGEKMWVVNAAFDPIRAVERIRIVVDMWAMGELESGTSVDEIHRHLDAIRKQILR
jgi:hypothetical protein